MDYAERYASMEYLGPASGYMAEIMEIIDRVILFEDFSVSEIEALCGYLHCYGAPRGVCLLNEQDQGDYLLIVFTGSVVVSRRADAGSGAKILATVGPGASLGEMSMIDGQPRFASCVTARPTDFAVLSRHDLNQVLVDRPRLGSKFLLILLQLMTRRLREAQVKLLPHIVSAAL
jgi:CRP/FNR family transcriptional regulator, cyclic AMP receptor protein